MVPGKFSVSNKYFIKFVDADLAKEYGEKGFSI